MTLSSTFVNALSGLRVSGRMTEVASHNLANALTDGYARQEVEVSSVALNGQGVGARVATVSRAMAPELLEAVSNAFVQDDSKDSIVHNETSALNQCLDGLSADKRELVAMRYESNSSFDEISRHTGSTPAAVQRALSRIRKLLHGCVQQRLRLAEGTS